MRGGRKEELPDVWKSVFSVKTGVKGVDSRDRWAHDLLLEEEKQVGLLIPLEWVRALKEEKLYYQRVYSTNKQAPWCNG